MKLTIWRTSLISRNDASTGEGVEDVVVGGYFNLDLSEIVNLPAVTKGCEVFVEMRDVAAQKTRKSNIVTIEFVHH